MGESEGFEPESQGKIQIWAKQVDSFHHYESMAQRSISILFTGIAIIVSFSIGALSIPGFREVLQKEIDFVQLSKGLVVDPLELKAIWLFSSISIIFLVFLSILFIYDAISIHASVLSLESPDSRQHQTGESGIETSIVENSCQLSKMQAKVRSGYTQAKRGALSLSVSLFISVYSFQPNGRLIFILFIICVICLYYPYSYRTLSEFSEKLFPHSSDTTSTSIITIATMVFLCSGLVVVLYTIAFFANIL